MLGENGRMGAAMTRRDVLALGLGAAASVAMPARGFALGRFAVGNDELISISDGGFTLPLAMALPGTPEDELKALLAESGLPATQLTPDCNVTLLRRADGLTLFDAGAGPNFLSTTGRLFEGLNEAGIDPADVTDVVFSHAHPDHLWGVLDDFDEIAFPNAAFHMAEAEIAFWTSDGAFAALPEARQNFVPGARNRIDALGERLQPIASGTPEVAGVEIVETFGHSPGHLSFVVHGASEQYLIGGDAIMHPVISFAHPEWPYGPDQDPETAIATRQRLLDRLAADRTRLIGYHLPHPGEGIVERKDGAYRYISG